MEICPQQLRYISCLAACERSHAKICCEFICKIDVANQMFAWGLGKAFILAALGHTGGSVPSDPSSPHLFEHKQCKLSSKRSNPPSRADSWELACADSKTNTRSGHEPHERHLYSFSRVPNPEAIWVLEDTQNPTTRVHHGSTHA